MNNQKAIIVAAVIIGIGYFAAQAYNTYHSPMNSCIREYDGKHNEDKAARYCAKLLGGSNWN